MNKNQKPSFKHWLITKYLPSVTSSSDKGYILITAVSIVLTMTGLMLLYGKTNIAEKATTVASVDSNSGFYAAEASLNKRAQQLREIVANYNKPIGTSPDNPAACLGDDKSKKGLGHYICEIDTYPGANNNRSGFKASTYIVEQNGGLAIQGQVPASDKFGGLNMQQYGHSIYAMAFKEGNYKTAEGKQPNAVLQLDLKSRVIPMFQFTAFYDGDLEILPSPRMILSGPIHTNGDLYLGSSNVLEVRGKITTVGELYNRRKDTEKSTYDDGKVTILSHRNELVNLLQGGTGATDPTRDAMNEDQIQNSWSTRVSVNTEDEIRIPSPEFLNSAGQYYANADIRIEYKPEATGDDFDYLDTIPFAVTSIDRTVSSAPETTLNEDQLRSLRQPVMVKPDLATIDVAGNAGNSGGEWLPNTLNYNICEPDTVINNEQAKNWWDDLTKSQKNDTREMLQEYVQEQLQQSTRPILFNDLNRRMRQIENDDDTYYDDDLFSDSSLVELSNTESYLLKNKLRNLTPQEIAGLPEYEGSGKGTPIADTSRCFIAAPITEIGRDDKDDESSYRFHNEREDREIRVLQMNVMSMAVWNRDGEYWDDSGDELVTTNNLLYTRADADSTAPENSFQRLGLAAKDSSQAGMVIHANIDTTSEKTPYSYKQGESPYAFAIIQAHQLFGLARSRIHQDPTGVTFASPQAIYVQGDFNTTNYQPASVLADSFTPLSNNCLTKDMTIHHKTGINCNTTNNLSKKDPNNTAFNGGLLAGTDVTPDGGAYSGGLENYPRFLEKWSDKVWRYRGSFISLDKPQQVSGKWGQDDVYKPPIRDWDFDLNFQDISNLPPLTPQFVVLKQEAFIRSFEE